MQTNLFIGCAPGANTITRKSRSGFTRLELFTVMGGIGLLMAIAVPALANKARSQQAGCFNNLRQIGRAFHLWGSDHGNRFPFTLTPADGGTGGSPNAWVQFGVLSNELASPQVLVCPSDDKKRPVGEFSTNPERGLFHANFRNSAVSYFVSHGFWRYPRAVIGGDRNIATDSTGLSCSMFGSGIAAIMPMSLTRAAWTNNLHVGVGHLLHVDGGVELTDNPNLSWTLRNSPTDFNRLHMAIP